MNEPSFSATPLTSLPTPPPRSELFTVIWDGRKWEFWTAPVDLLRIQFSQETQRSFSRPFVDLLKVPFIPPAVLIVVAVYPDGREEMVGGHHCATAAKELGFERWPWGVFCRVNNEVEAAEFCLALLTTRQAGSADTVAIAVRSKKPSVLAHINLLQRAGRSWSKEKRTAETWNIFNVITATQWVEKRVGENGLIEQLVFANECWTGQPQVCTNEVVKAVFHLFRDWRTGRGKFPHDQIRAALATISLKDILKKSYTEVTKEENFRPESRPQKLARVMAEHAAKSTPGLRLGYSPPAASRTKKAAPVED